MQNLLWPSYGIEQAIIFCPVVSSTFFLSLLGLFPWTQFCSDMICMQNISAKLQMRLLCHWMHYTGEKLSRVARHWACDWIIEHRRGSMLGQGRGNSSPKPRHCCPNISAYRCKKEHSVAFKIRQNAFPAGALPQTPLGELTALCQAP